MAQIPDWTALPEAVPQPSFRRVTVDESGQMLAQAGENLGQGLQRSGDELFARQQKLLAAKGENAVLDHRLAVQNLAEQTRQQIADGQLPYEQARQSFDDQVGKLQAPSFDGLSAPVAESLRRETQRSVAAAGFGIDNAVVAARKDDFKAQFGAGLDKLGKLAGMPDADIGSINQQADVFRPLARSAGLPEAYVDKTLQDFKDRNWFNQATQRAMESKDNYTSLTNLERDLTDKDGYYAGKLDTDKRNAVLRTVINDRLILENRAQHEADKREAKAQHAIGQINEQVASGIPATPDMWANWESTVKGTSFEPDFDAAQNDEKTVQDVLRRPVDQQVNYVQGLQADLQKNGGSLKERANLVRLQTAVNQNVNLLEKAPLLYSANRNGTDVQSIDFSGLNSPEGQQEIGATITDRMATLKAMQKQYGSAVHDLPLLPQEAGLLTNQLQSATPPQRTQMLVALRNSMGDDNAYEATMRQIAPHSPVTAIAGAMVGRNAPAQTPVWYSPDYAPKLGDVEKILHGEALLNPASGGKEAAAEQESGKGAFKAMPMPPDGGAAGLRMAFAQEVGDMFRDRPQLGEAYYSVFKDAYAALLAEKGDMKGVGDSSVQRQAMQIALGNRARFNGQSFSVPPGMDPSRFESYITTAVQASSQEQKASDKWVRGIRGYGLREIGGLGSGRYVLTNGNLAVARPDGAGPFTINLRDQYLPGQAPTAPAQPSAEDWLARAK